MEVHDITCRLEGAGFKARLLPAEHLGELRGEIIRLKEAGLIDGRVYDSYLVRMRQNQAEVMPGAGSVLIAAHPQYMTRLMFTYRGSEFPVIIPPTYIAKGIGEKAERVLEGISKDGGYVFRAARLPMKLLAVRAGLGSYGRNNICYIEGFGSFHRLLAYYTDAPCQSDSWGEVTVMPQCESCKACVKACPTGCIDAGRHMIHAEGCMTFYNESDTDIPDKVDKEWHNALVGCMRCQEICPMNRSFWGRYEAEAHFGAEETGMIMDKTPLEGLPVETRRKLDKFEMSDYYNILQRNLSLLIE